MDLKTSLVINLVSLFLVFSEVKCGTKYKRVDIASAKDKLVNVDSDYGGTIFVGGKKQKYAKGMNSTVLVRALKLPTSRLYSNFVSYVGFKFIHFDVPDKWPWSGTCGDYVEIFEELMTNDALTKSEFNSGICADLFEKSKDNYDFFTNASDIALIRFVSDMAVEGSGFEVSFTSFYPTTGTTCYSESGEFFCKNKNCIAQTMRCNKLDNCGDNSDEKGCVYDDEALDFLKEVMTTVAENYALIIAIFSFSSMIFSVILAFCVRVVFEDEAKRLRKAQKKQNFTVGPDGKKIINPNLKAPVFRRNPGL